MTAAEVIAALPEGAEARECVLIHTLEGYRLMILLEDHAMALDFTGPAAKPVRKAWQILTGAVWRGVGQYLQ